MIKINVGCGWRNFGKEWLHVDGGDYPHLDMLDLTLPSFVNEVDLIYASHVLEYFNYQEAQKMLEHWYTALKERGEIYISVPDFREIVYQYAGKNVPLPNLLGPLYGKMSMGKEEIYHRCVWDEQTLTFMLKLIGFKRIERYNPTDLIGKHDDHSKAKLNDRLISLNLKAVK
jgi:predicted SAM-dependent methyltransferase